MAKASSPGALATDVLCEMEDQLSATTPENAWPYFITCFSAKENDLNQWRAYGRGEGGFAIGFASAKLIPKQSLTYLAPAIYDEGLKSMLVDEFVRWIIQEYPKRASLSAAAQRNEHRKNWVEWLLYIAAVAAPIMKNPSFAEEEEWRLVSPSEDRSLMCFLPKLTGLVPYIEFSYEKLPIRILWSGPGRMTRQSLQAGRALLEKHSYPDVNLKSSDIPYRVG
jgi:hypothetical protein